MTLHTYPFVGPYLDLEAGRIDRPEFLRRQRILTEENRRMEEELKQGITYVVTSTELKKEFEEKETRCLAIAKEHSGEGKDDQCNHGIVIQYETQAEAWAVRSQHLEENAAFVVDGETLADIFRPIRGPVKVNQGLLGMVEAEGPSMRGRF